MLYSIIVALALAIPVSAFLCFSLGYKAGRAVRDDKELPRMAQIMKPAGNSRPEPFTEEQKRLNQILRNIDTYDGTEEGQVKL